MLALMSKQAIRRDARAKASTASDSWSRPFPVMQRREDVQDVCDVARVKYPVSKFKNIVQPYPEMLRTQAPEWWGRQLKKADMQKVESAELRAGNVRLYCSDTILSARKRHTTEMREMLEKMLAVCELPDGTRVEKELMEMVMASPANPAVQRAELMTHIRGTENYATQKKHVAYFFTITCPSRFHCNSGDRWLRAGAPSPRAANDYLCDVWAKTRTALARLKIKFYGFRVAEPHKDGCPHWHCLFWFRDRNEGKQAIYTIREYFLEDTPGEKGAQLRRVTVKRINPKKGSATGYIAKYLCKNIDGEYTDKGESLRFDDMRRDPETGELKHTGVISDEAAYRVKAWAGCWRIRQFQRIGLPRVGVWRELRRMKDPIKMKGQEGEDLAEGMRVAADKGQWDLFMTLDDEHRERFEDRAKVWTETSADKLARVDMADDAAVLGCLNKWQEPKMREVKGVRIGWLAIKTRFMKWVLMLKQAEEKKEGGISVKQQFKAELSAFVEKIHAARREAVEWSEAMAAQPPWPLEPCQ